MQLFLWAPSLWLNPSERLPSSDDVSIEKANEFRVNSLIPSGPPFQIIEWLFCMTTKVLCENIFTGPERSNKKDSYTEYLLISSFLQRASLSRIKQALLWIRTVNRQ